MPALPDSVRRNARNGAVTSRVVHGVRSVAGSDTPRFSLIMTGTIRLGPRIVPPDGAGTTRDQLRGRSSHSDVIGQSPMVNVWSAYGRSTASVRPTLPTATWPGGSGLVGTGLDDATPATT